MKKIILMLSLLMLISSCVIASSHINDESLKRSKSGRVITITAKKGSLNSKTIRSYICCEVGFEICGNPICQTAVCGKSWTAISNNIQAIRGFLDLFECD
jgi:hypothetical protein